MPIAKSIFEKKTTTSDKFQPEQLSNYIFVSVDFLLLTEDILLLKRDTGRVNKNLGYIGKLFSLEHSRYSSL